MRICTLVGKVVSKWLEPSVILLKVCSKPTAFARASSSAKRWRSISANSRSRIASKSSSCSSLSSVSAITLITGDDCIKCGISSSNATCSAISSSGSSFTKRTLIWGCTVEFARFSAKSTACSTLSACGSIGFKRTLGSSTFNPILFSVWAGNTSVSISGKLIFGSGSSV